jgi:hypothetical protein
VCLNMKPPCSLNRRAQHLMMGGQRPRIASASASHRRVEPSISVNRNVTTPEGGTPADTPAESHNRRGPTSHIGGSGPKTPAPRGAA